MINDATHWKIVFAALREAVASGNNEDGRKLAGAAADMITRRKDAYTYECSRDFLIAQTKRSRFRRGVGPDPKADDR